MHVAIVGAGALGRVYGVRLRLHGDAGVTLVVRPGHLEDRGAIRIERIDGENEVDTWEEPALATRVPDGADVVLVAVRAEQLDSSLDGLLGTTGPPIVVLTPMMPGDSSRLVARYGGRLRAAMVGVVAYTIRRTSPGNAAGVSRYWLPRSATTLIDDTSEDSEAIGGASAMRDLVHALVTAGFRTRLESHVLDSNLATTVAIAPAAMGIDAAGSIDALLADRALRDLTVAAIKEGLALSGKVGKGASWLGYLTPFVGTTMLRIGASLGKSQAPEAFAYVEEHFGRKLHAQNVAMGRALVDLAKSRHTSSRAIESLLERLTNS